MGRFLSYKSWFVAFFLAVLPLRLAAQETPLVVGLLPTLSPRVLITNYQPFRIYLERQLKRPVEMVTATDFTAFHKSTMAGEYDLVVTAAHLARLAQIEAGYIPLAAYQSVNQALLVTSKADPLKFIKDLRGNKIATLDRVALISLQTKVWLEKQGLYEDKDYQLLKTSSHNSSVYSVLSGESKLAIIAPGGYKMLPSTMQDSIQTLATLPEVPMVMWVAHPRLLQAVPSLRANLLSFSPDLLEGKQFFDSTNYQGMRKITSKEMKSLDPYIPYLKQHLGQ